MNKILFFIFAISSLIYSNVLSQSVYRNGTDLTTAQDGLNFKLKTASTIFAVDLNITNSPYDELKFILSVISDKSNLRDELKINGNNYLDIGNFISTTEGRFYDKIKLSKEKLYIFIKINNSNKIYKLNNESLTDPAKNLYNSDLEEFRKLYGDSYAYEIFTGSTTFGLLEIPINTPQERVSIQTLIDTKTSIDTKDELYNFIDFLDSEYRLTNVYTLLNNSYDIEKSSLSDFKNKIISFINDDTLTCSDDNFLECAFLVNFKLYSTLFDINTIVSTKQKLINDYIYNDHLYANIINDIDYIKNNANYFIDTNVDTLIDLENNLEMQKSRLKYFSLNCQLGEECKDISTYDTLIGLEFPKENNLREQLPVEKVYYPKDCKALQGYYLQSFHDREYKLYIKNDSNKNVNIYCFEMNTSEPSEYIALTNSKVNYQNEDVSLSHIKVNLNNDDGDIEAYHEYLTVDTNGNKSIYLVDDNIKYQNTNISTTNFLFDNTINNNNYDTNLNTLSGYYAVLDISNIPDISNTLVSTFIDEQNEVFNNKASSYFSNLDYKILKNHTARLPITETDDSIIYDVKYGLENIDQTKKLILKLK